MVSRTSDVTSWVHPRLTGVVAAGNTLTLTVRARVGQTVDDLERAAPSLGAAAAAVSWRCRVLSPAVLELQLVMIEALNGARAAATPTRIETDAVMMGRRQSGQPWRLQLRGRHTLVVGCSGSGKGSMLWGVCGGLAPAVSTGLVRLWGIDLKRGVEVLMGRGLFSAIATTPAEALLVLAALLRLIGDRAQQMAGSSRLHEPSRTDPLHVLVIDELAALIAYADPEIRREGSRLLSEVLTQGRALGVVVLACVQDPRKETVGMRGLFTQVVALRLRSADETRMTLGDGMSAIAPAHHLSAAAPGSAWVVEEDGHVDRVRGDFWSDDLVRATAAAHCAPTRAPAGPDLTPSAEGSVQDAVIENRDPARETPGDAATPTARRSPRTPRRRGQKDRSDDGEAA